MKLKIAKIVILIFPILLVSCKNINELADKPTAINKVEISTTVKREDKPEEVEKKQVSGVPQNQFKKSDESEDCLLSKRKILAPKIWEEIGDTINIKKVNNWVLSSEITEDDDEIRKIINRGRKFFKLNETENFASIGFLEDEGEYLAIYVYTIDKESCKIIGKEMIAETTAWEHEYKETYSLIQDEYTIKRITLTGSKDWGDYSKWIRDTLISMMIFSEKGQINLEER